MALLGDDVNNTRRQTRERFEDCTSSPMGRRDYLIFWVSSGKVGYDASSALDLGNERLRRGCCRFNSELQ